MYGLRPTHRLAPVPDEVDLDMLLGGRREFTSRQVSEAVGMPTYRARRYWRALGLANVPDNDREFTQADVEALTMLVAFIRDGVLDETQTVEVARALGRAASRLSFTLAEELGKILDTAGASGFERRSAARETVERTLPEMDKLVLYSWRRHLAVAIQRLEPYAGSEGQTTTTVGFADLVSFTRLSRQLSDHDLESLVERFESRVADLVTSYGGRVIKSLGDEVLFVADDPSVGADIAVDLVEIIRRRPRIPGVRIGLEMGQVIKHAGDVFGDTVNLASRLTAMADPNGILVGPRLADALGGNRDYQLSPTPPMQIRGYGVVTPSNLRASEPNARIFRGDSAGRWVPTSPTDLWTEEQPS